MSLPHHLFLVPVLLLHAAAASPPSPDPAPRRLELESLNRAYPQILTDPVPVSLGVLTVRLASPQHVLNVRSHRAELGPATSDGREARLEVELEGTGQLIADIFLGERSTRLEDELVLPVQRLYLAGRVEVVRVEAGFRVTVLALPEQVEVEIQSSLGQQVVSLCRAAPLGALLFDCEAVERLLSRVRVPLPPSGTTYFLRDAQLTVGERRRLEALLAL